MLYAETTATRKIARLSKRYRAVQGGTSASKTISILLILIAQAQTDYDCTQCNTHGCQDRTHTKSWVMKPTLTSIVSESFPHLSRGAIRDFLNIMQGHNYYREDLWNRTNYIYTFETGSKIEFFSVDSPDKTRGPRRDRLFMNECNNIPFEAFNQLEVRTREQVWLDWNPTNEFWFYTEILNNPELSVDLDHIIITYRDNEALEESIVKSIEARRMNKNWWLVYGEGQLGEVEGKIYKGWKSINDIPHEARLVSRGIDFGFSNDPTAIVDIYYYNGGYILDERLHRKGMHNSDIATFLNNLDKPETVVIADSAEPKSIAEIAMHGVPIIPATKGQGSVNAGIDFVQQQQISYTATSPNLKKAYNNYLWQTDRDGKIINKPDHYLSDQMDAVRYGMETIRPHDEEEDAQPFAGVSSLIY